MNILKFEDSTIISDNSHIKNEYENGVIYEHTLQFLLPYHLNMVIKKDIERSISGSAYTTKKDILLFDDFDSKVGRLGTGYLKRTSVFSAYVYKGKININSDRFTKDWIESIKENIPFYRLVYTTIKNGNKMYSEKGLDKLKEEFPEYYFI